jgi:hypothetical protein
MNTEAISKAAHELYATAHTSPPLKSVAEYADLLRKHLLPSEQAETPAPVPPDPHQPLLPDDPGVKLWNTRDLYALDDSGGGFIEIDGVLAGYWEHDDASISDYSSGKADAIFPRRVWNPEHLKRLPELREFVKSWRASRAKSEPDPHDPLGDGSVEVFSTPDKVDDVDAVAYLFVDNIRAGYLARNGTHVSEAETFYSGVGHVRRVWNPAHKSFDFAAFRDKVRASRAEAENPKLYTLESWPGGFVIVRREDGFACGAKRGIVTDVDEWGVMLGNRDIGVTWEGLAKFCTMSLDGGKSWSPCVISPVSTVEALQALYPKGG